MIDAAEVPLIEQLRSVPKDYRTSYAIQWDESGNETGHRFLPVGYMMHRAADELDAAKQAQERAEKDRDNAWEAFQRLRRAYAMIRYPTLNEEIKLLYASADAVATGKDKDSPNIDAAIAATPEAKP